jgi:hypothetical protein
MSGQNSVEAIKVGEKGFQENLIRYRVDNLPWRNGVNLLCPECSWFQIIKPLRKS